MKKLLSLLLIMLLTAPAYALDVAGVKLDDSAKVGDASLPLNGAGLRTRMFIKVYVGALYLAKKPRRATLRFPIPAPNAFRCICCAT